MNQIAKIFQTHLCFILLLFLFLILSACGEKPRLNKLAAGDLILSFGDSLTYGTGAKPNSSYPAVLAQLSGMTVINAGVPGELSRAGAERLASALDEHQPKLLILCHGGNDMLRKKPQAQTKAQLEQMILEAKSRGISVLLLGVPTPKLLVLKPNPMYQELAQKHGLPIEEKIVAHVLSKKSLKSDPIHPNNNGYREIATAVYNLLISYKAL